MGGRLPLTHSRALFKMRNKLFGLLPVLQPASKGEVLPLSPPPLFPLRPNLIFATLRHTQMDFAHTYCL